MARNPGPRYTPPTGQPGYIPLGNGTSYNPVTQHTIQTSTPSSPGGPIPTPAPAPTPTPTTTTEPSGGGGGEAEPAFSASQMLENLIRAAIGVSGLGNWAAGLYNRGASATEIVQALRYGTDSSPEGTAARQAYLNTFPGMDKFLKDGIFAGESPEMQYTEYRNTVREAGARYGVAERLLTNDKIASYIEGRKSAAEMASRMNLGATAAATTPPETLAILQDKLGVTAPDLLSFYIDTDGTEAELTKRVTAARIGTEAMRQRFDLTGAEMTSLAERGITPDESTNAFGLAYDRLALGVGRGDVLSRDQIIDSAFGDAPAQEAAARAIGARRGQFGGGGQFVSTQSGVGGLGASNS